MYVLFCLLIDLELGTDTDPRLVALSARGEMEWVGPHAKKLKGVPPMGL